MSRSRTHRLRAGLLLAGVVGAVAPAAAAGTSAHAATAASVQVVNGTVVVYDGGTGNTNDVRVFLDRGVLTITDAVAITTAAGSGCTVTGTRARCGTGITGLNALLNDGADAAVIEAPLTGVVRGGDGDDVFRSAVTGGLSAVAYDGGAGFADRVEYRDATGGVTVSLDDVANDGRTLTGDRDDVRSSVEHLVGSAHRDTLTGSEGRNTIEGLRGDDTLRGLGGTDFFPSSLVVDGADSISGGAGDRDAVSYVGRPRGVVVDLDGAQGDDGEPGERDSIGADVERLSGTRFGDVLVGNASINEIEGLEGVDHLHGLGLGDSLRGGDGADVVVGGDGDDSITLNTDGDVDTLDCGRGRDRFSDERGVDVLVDCEVRL
ncbi:hypothetical protein [Kineococcus glutinatus]|uniref:Hemolysin type calcium-binding protein n=1 Tax=Kineococcus glutinatus TaxID=1070872 RepID=A0ABP9I8B7_9ACTN